jgi:hypothetical protein
MTNAPRPIPDAVERGAAALYERRREKSMMHQSTPWKWLCEPCKREYREEATCVIKAVEHDSASSS